jgi:multidrug efflux pump subunit AcrA (membrane-fusion protein)
MSARHLIGAVVVAAVAAGAGWWAGSARRDGEASGPCPGGGAALYWRAPMDPTYVRNEPGKSPMGMDLVPACPGDAASAPTSGADDDGSVRVDPRVVQTMGVRVQAVERRDLVRRVRTVGRVAWDERRVAHVHTKVQGWVERLHAQFQGQEVARGEALLEIYSPELVSTQEELLVAVRYRDATASSPLPDVRRGGEAMFDATRRRLALWDIPDAAIDRLVSTGAIRKTLTLYAPAGGIITSLGVREGMEVKPSDNLYTIADLSRVWVHADIYEHELPWVAVGQRGTVELSYLPGRSFTGDVTYVDPFLDPRTRTARVRLELENPDRVLKPEMFANVELETEGRPAALAVPDEAVIRSGRRNLVLVAKGEGHFEPRDVALGLDGGDGWIEVLSGVQPGEQVVVSGQFLIDSESRLQEAVRKLLRDEGEGAAEAAPMDHSEHQHEPAPMQHEGQVPAPAQELEEPGAHVHGEH